MPTILIADDEEPFRTVIQEEIGRMGYDTFGVGSGEEALDRLGSERDEADVLLLDMKMPGMGGMATLEAVKREHPQVEVIVLTGHGNVADAIQAIKIGAYDYITKPCTLDELEALLSRACEKRRLVLQNQVLKGKLSRQDGFPEFVGTSKVLLSTIEVIKKVAPTDSTVLVQGESGTGKELAATGIHRLSKRWDQPFVVVDCGALHENLLESEMFGHEKGAYTGAVALKHGLFEVADGGTVFLDEIGELSPATQVKLLRVLEVGTFRRLGGTRDIRVDTRIIAATNRNLGQMVKAGQFREELYYRLNVIALTLPPLRDRKEDIPLLAKSFLGGRKDLDAEALEILESYAWPGNIRELQNILEAAIILSEERVIKAKDLPYNLRTDAETVAILGRSRSDTPFTLKEMKQKYVTAVLDRCNGNREKAATILGISTRNIYRMLGKEQGTRKGSNLTSNVTKSHEQ